MKTILPTICVFIIITSVFNPAINAQTINPKKSIVNLGNGVTSPIGLNTNSTNVTTFSINTCDGNDVRIFPSTLPQSEVHISINKQNPNVLLLSATTFPTSNS